jgi:hypothetical protein
MADIQAGTKFAAIAPNVNVDRRSAQINARSLEYTIEDIINAVGGQSIKYIYPTLIQLSSSVPSNSISYTGVTVSAGDATCGTVQLNFQGGGVSWANGGTYLFSVETTAILPSFNSVLNISLDLFGASASIIPINNALQGGGGFAVLLRNVGTSTSVNMGIAVNWSITN